MADGTGFGAFHDSEQDLEAMHRYEAFLQLQLEADGLTDEEYLTKLDRISGGDPSELLHGATAYGSEDIARMREETAVRDASELVDKYGYEDADGLTDGVRVDENGDPAKLSEDGGTVKLSEDGGTVRHDGEQIGNGDGTEPSEGVSKNPVDGIAAGTSVALEDGEDPEKGHDGEDGEEAGHESHADAFEAAAMAAAGTGYDGQQQEDKSEELEQEAVPEEGPGKQAQAEEIPAGPAAIPDYDDEKAGKNDAAVPYGGGHFEARSEYRINDVFDSIAAGTGTLSGAIVGYEYVPEQKGPAVQKEPPQMTPALAAMYREMARTDEREMEKMLDGPSR